MSRKRNKISVGPGSPVFQNNSAVRKGVSLRDNGVCSTTAGCGCDTIEWPKKEPNREEYRRFKKAMRAFFGKSFIRRNGSIA